MANTPPCLLLCFHTESTEQIPFALDYWAGSMRAGEWLWLEPVKEIAARYGLKNGSLAKAVRQIATAYDLSLRCACQAECAGAPREVACRSDVSSSGFEYICDKCRALIMHKEEREEQERARARVLKKRAFLASLIAQSTPFDYATMDYADAVAVYAMMLASDRACESGQLEPAAFKLFASEAMNQSLRMDLFQKGILAVSDDSSLDCIELLEGGGWRYEVSRMRWRLAVDAHGLPFPEVFERVGVLVDQRETHVQFDDFVREFWWRIAVDDATQFLASETQRFRFPEYRYGPKTQKAMQYALESYSIPQVRNLIKRSVGYAAQLSVSRNYYGGAPLATVPTGGA